jgi:hypothetical protein
LQAAIEAGSAAEPAAESAEASDEPNADTTPP